MTLRRLLTVLTALALVTVGCEAGAPDPARPSPARPSPAVPARNAADAPLLPSDAFALPEFDLAMFQDLIAQLEGTPVVVNFWGSWCDPCREEAEDLAAAHERYGDRVQFIGVDILDAREGARAFMREFGWTYPSVFDPPGAVRDGLGVLGQPVTLFYDAEGELVDRWVGPVPPDELATRIERILPS